MEFKERLRIAIVATGKTQKQIATEVGIVPGMLSMYLRGSEPRRPTYERLLDVLPALRETPKVAP